jgi:argininosuccinate lyase
MSAPATSGRLRSEPARLLDEEVLGPQFRYELTHLLPHYVHVERILLLEYLRMGVLSPAQVTAVDRALQQVCPESLRSDRTKNLSDISFALERFVLDRLPSAVPAWHVDRSRNDAQATAQLLFGRAQVLRAAADAAALARAAHTAAAGARDLPMPGYTHLQAAQVISPGFYLAALIEEVLGTLRRMLTGYDEIDRCPLGAGPMAGQELAWDRQRMAQLAGFARAQPHALTAVASRTWVLSVTGELSAFAIVLSRFVTDLMAFSSEAYGFVELPDELAGISAAMPQKKNYPVLERIRGRTGHVTALAQDIAIGLRNTPYTNSVEASKEATAHLVTLFAANGSALRMLTAVVGAAGFRADRMRAACRRSYLGGFSLAIRLTLEHGLPWRQAQVAAGEYIAEAIARDLPPDRGDPDMLSAVCRRHGCQLGDPGALLREAFDADRSLRRYASAGSATPDAVGELLTDQAARLRAAELAIATHAGRAAAAGAEVDRLLAAPDRGDGTA